VARLAGSAPGVWGSGSIPSPGRREGQPDARREAQRMGAPGGQLELPAAAPAAREPPRRHRLDDAHDDQSAVEEHDVDREPHPGRVDAAEGVGEQQPLARPEPAPAEQAARRAQPDAAGHLDPGDEGPSARGVDDALHGGTIDRPRMPRARAIVAVARGSRTRRRATPTGPDRPRALRYAPHVIDEDFRSGDDIALAFLGRRYAFSRPDFEQRVVRAAADLDLVAGPVARATRADLVEAAIIGRLEAPRSDAGERIAELQRTGAEDPVYWLRKLVFRSAWLDHRIKHGLVDVAYDDSTGSFRLEPGRYPLPGYGHPSFAAVGAGEEPA
jgi:hypothetical protein